MWPRPAHSTQSCPVKLFASNLSMTSLSLVGPTVLHVNAGDELPPIEVLLYVCFRDIILVVISLAHTDSLYSSLHLLSKIISKVYS